MDKFTNPFKQNRLVNVIFLSGVFLSFHYALVAYINSSFLASFFSDTQISTLYVLGALTEIIILLNISKIINKISNYRLTLYVIVLEFISMLGLISTTNPFLLAIYFISQMVCIPILGFNLDLFLDKFSTDESKTGEVRGMYLSLGNITWIIAPALVALFLFDSQYWRIYTLALVFLVPLYFYIRNYFKNSSNFQLPDLKTKESIKEYMDDKNLYNILLAQFTLQFFYAFMVVYTPLYLHNNIGFAWQETGLIFTIMLLPFVLFELPVGDLADRKYGEKEFLTLGLVIMGLFTMLISFITVKSFWLWAIVLFMTRVGASLVEVTTDSYFFKKINRQKMELISLYRMNRPLSYIITPILVVIAMQFVPFQYLFLLIGTVVIIGTRFAIKLEDTK